MADPSDIRNAPGFDSAVSSYSTVTKSMQTFASEMQRMSKDTMDSTSSMMEKLRGAKTMEDVVAIQTGFMQQSFSNYADFTRRFSELMMSVPMELAKNSKSAFQQGTDAMQKAGEQMGDQFQRAGDQFTHR